MMKKAVLFTLILTCFCLFVSCAADCQHLDEDHDGICDLCDEIYMPNEEWFTVHFVTNGGNSISTAFLRYEAALPTATREGYTFGGWFADAALSVPLTAMPAKNVTVYAYWAEENKPSDFSYEGRESYTVTGYLASDATVVVPSYIGGVAVDAISAEAFAGNKQISALHIPASVTYLAPGALSGCENVTALTVEAGNEIYYSVENCIVEAATQTLVLGCQASVIPTDGTVVAIGEAAFEGCTGLQELMLPAAIVKIGERAFSGCSSLAAIAAEEENAVFYSVDNCLIARATQTLVIGCKNSVIPYDGSVTAIGPYAFAGCEGLTQLSLPFALLTIDNNAFFECTGLTAISFPATLYSIGFEAFAGCSSLALVEFSPSTMLASIQNYAFADCSALTSVTVPLSVTSIGFAAFAGCDRLESVTLPFAGNSANQSGRTHFGYIFGAEAFADNATVLPTALFNVTLTSATFIGDNAFYGCAGLTNVTLPDTLTSIGSHAFYGCRGLTAIVIPWRVQNIDYSAFFACAGLSEITVDSDNSIYLSAGNTIIKKDTKTLVIGCKASVIPTDGSVTAIGPYAFYGCSALESIHIPLTVTSIGGAAFRYCVGLLSITVESGNTAYKSVGNCLIETATKTLLLGCQGSVIPTDGSITAIGAYAFAGYTTLTRVSIPAGVTAIGDFAFSGCSNLSVVEIPATVSLIGSEAFSACTSLIDVRFENTAGWWCASILYASSGVMLLPSDLADAATAAGYLKDTYCTSYWRCDGVM